MNACSASWKLLPGRIDVPLPSTCHTYSCGTVRALFLEITRYEVYKNAPLRCNGRHSFPSSFPDLHAILALLILPLIGSWATVVTLEPYHRFVSGPVPQLACCTSP